MEGGCGVCVCVRRVGGGVSMPGRWAHRKVDEADLSKVTYPDSLVASLQRAMMEEEGA